MDVRWVGFHALNFFRSSLGGSYWVFSLNFSTFFQLTLADTSDGPTLSVQILYSVANFIKLLIWLIDGSAK
jgi:hypothetical protein